MVVSPFGLLEMEVEGVFRQALELGQPDLGRPAYGAVNSTRSAISTRRGCRRCIAIPSQ